MRSKLFSPLIRGHGPEWSADFKWYEDQPSKAPNYNDTGQHSRYVIHDRHLYRTVPKTFTTNKGAIVLYTSEDYVVKDKLSQAVHPASTKEFQTSDLDNLQRNILQFGTSEEDKTCLRFTRPNVDDVYLDESNRPGALPEVYLEDLKYKTRLLTKTNKMAVARLRPTERVKTARTQCSSPTTSLFAESPDSPSSSRPDSGAEKRRLLRPPSAPPQLMPSVEKRKAEIIRDQMKHLDAAQRRERMKYADFEFVSTIPDHLQVKGLGGKVPKRRAYSSPVYKTQYNEDKSYVTCDQTKSVPLFIVTSSPTYRRSLSRTEHPAPRGSHDSEGSMDPEAKRDALLDAKNLINEISSSKKSRRKRGGKDKDSKEGDSKKKTVKSAKSKKEPETPIIPVSDGEFKEKQPPKSLVAMHKDNIDSSVSITKKKGSQSGSKKRRSAKSSDRVAWDTDPRNEEVNSETEDVISQPPQTMLLDSDNEDQTGARQRKRTDRSLRQRSDQALDKTAPNTPSTSADLSKTAEMSGTLTKDGRRSHDLEEGEEDMEERMRQEERDKELKTLELLERRIGIEDGSLKRLGEKVEIIEKETNQQKDKEAALRQLEMEEESARKEEERRAYEEVMRAQEAEYEKHLQNMLRQEEERNKQYLDSLRKEEIQRDIKRKLAMFRQHQNLELRQHVRLSKLKQKITVPFKYSYFPILKVNYMKIVMNPEQSLRKSSGGNNKNVKKKKMTLKRV